MGYSAFAGGEVAQGYTKSFLCFPPPSSPPGSRLLLLSSPTRLPPS